MEIEVDDSIWCVNSNKGGPRQQTLEKQTEVQKQVLAALANEVISTSQAEFYCQVHLTPKPVTIENVSTDSATSSSAEGGTPPGNLKPNRGTGWRFCIDF
jgi:glycerol kinase